MRQTSPDFCRSNSYNKELLVQKKQDEHKTNRGYKRQESGLETNLRRKQNSVLFD